MWFSLTKRKINWHKFIRGERCISRVDYWLFICTFLFVLLMAVQHYSDAPVKSHSFYVPRDPDIRWTSFYPINFETKEQAPQSTALK